MNHFSKAFIAIFSEAIWIYFAIVLFTGVEWGDPLFFPVTWWVIAGVLGYTLQLIFSIRPVHYLINIVSSIIVCSFIIVYNWLAAVPEGFITFGICLTVAVGFIFTRSSIFFYKEPRREQMLHRFEGNIIFYIVFALIFLFNPWDVEVSFIPFHIVFLVAILLSLFGMILTLHTLDEENEDIDMDIYRVGQSRSFLTVISLILLLVVVVSLTLFMPSVRNVLYVAANSGLEGLKWVYQSITNLMAWLAQLMTTSEDGGNLPEPIPEEPIQGDMEMEEPTFSLPLPWIFGSAAFVAIIVALWFIAKFLKDWNPQKKIRPKAKTSFKGIDIKTILGKVGRFISELQIRFKAKFLRYYDQPVYYYFYRLEKWGSKNGLKRKTTETAQEFTERAIEILTSQDKRINASEMPILVKGLRKISYDYQAASFGGVKQSAEKEYKQLLEQLKSIRLGKKRMDT